MARVTVEDCLEKVANRFELVLLASKRARQIGLGTAIPLVKEDHDKPTVLALREIAEGKIDASLLEYTPADTIVEEITAVVEKEPITTETSTVNPLELIAKEFKIEAPEEKKED